MIATSWPNRRRFSPAEDVANRLRERILSGELADGAMLPKIDDLSDQFQVSRAAIREASLILESEGLLTVLRGNVGGSMVHIPTPQHMAYALGLVLQARNVQLPDVRVAIERFEPICVELCTERVDRATTIIPALQSSQLEYAAALDVGDGDAAVVAARRWHQALVTHCGNDTIVATLAMLQTLWTSHLRVAAARTRAEGGAISAPDSHRGIDEHQRIEELIASGDAVAAAEEARRHNAQARVHTWRPDELESVKASIVREFVPQNPVAIEARRAN